MTFSIADAIKEGAQQLRAAGVAEGQRDAALLLAHLLDRDRTFIIAHAGDALNHEQFEFFQSLIERRAVGEPLQYITGHQEFFKLDFEVTPAVLIPRPETELIVETALELLPDDRAARIADIGTGSGCLAISLLHERPAARAVAIDVSPAALRIAQRNANRHGVADRLDLLGSDTLSALDAAQVEWRFDLIVSNPPYVSEDEMKTLQREVNHEPRTALAAGADGLSIIRRLLHEARPFLRSGGHLVFEIGFGQSGAVEQLIDPRVWKLLEIRKDLQGIPRTFVLQKK
ncbi:MAG TPA: peptide chain release factor N(5)-glutamine methyltransferase [Pyrinomonadaceae bacterium]|nr:peptide chain release factor N(5)-glutamine methyltransferase [Pyrinomonadaceae bacterium]